MFHFCIGNQGTHLQLLWLSWLRFVPTRDLLAAMVPPPSSSREARNDPGLRWCRTLGAPALLAPGAAGAGCRRAPFLIPAVNQRSDLQGFGTGRHRETGTGAGGSTAGRADPRLGQTQGAWVRQGYCLTSVAFLCRTPRIVFLKLVLSNTLRSEGGITNSYHVVKTYKSVISHSL